MTDGISVQGEQFNAVELKKRKRETAICYRIHESPNFLSPNIRKQNKARI